VSGIKARSSKLKKKKSGKICI
jgi:hypothetical protein